MFCQKGSEFFLLALCVCACVCVCGGGGQVQYLPFREKITHPVLLINDWSLNQKVPRVTTSLIFFKIFLVIVVRLEVSNFDSSVVVLVLELAINRALYGCLCSLSRQ